MKPPVGGVTAARGLVDTDPPVAANRYGRYEARVEDLRTRAGLLVTPLGVCGLPSGVELVRTEPGDVYDWAFCMLGDDPVFQKGHLHIPRDVQRKLRHLDDVGVSFDALVIGHEVDKSKSRAAVDAASKTQLLAGTAETVAPPRSVEWTNAAVRALAGTARLAGAAAAALTSVAADPVLIGAITVDGTTTPKTPAALFLLASWS